MMRTMTRVLAALAAAAAASVLSSALAGSALAGPAFAAPVAAVPAAVEAPALAAAVGPVAGDVNAFSFRSMHADYTLGREADGTSTLRVVETFVAVFPSADQNRGIRRSIPDTYNGQPLDPALVSVTDGSGRARPAEVNDSDGAFTITSRAGTFLHGEQTFVFTYTLRHVTWTFADTNADEFYWDVNGVDWAQPFGEIGATLHVPAALAGSLTGARSCYHGAQGSSAACEIRSTTGTDGAVTVTAAASDLPPHATMTIAVGFTVGTFTPFDASYFASPWGWVQAAAALALLGALVAAIVVRLRRLRDAAGRPTIIAEYAPPPGIDALQSAVLLGKPGKGVPAEVLEQAVGGSLRILEGTRGAFGLGRARLQAELVDPSRADEDGRMLLRGMFGGALQPGATFSFGRSNARFSRAAQKMLAWAGRRITTQGLRLTVPVRSRAVPLAVGALALAAVVAAGVAALTASVDAVVPVLILILGVLMFVAVVVLLSRRPLSAAGAELRDHLKGLELFIEWAEADRIRMLQSPAGAERVRLDARDPRQVLKLYEQLLPYAIVFGQEKKWVAQVAAMYESGYGATAAPYWYVGTGSFDAAAFTAAVGGLSAAAASSSSTSGGSGGGGFAGGGGGGGGGGGV